MPIYVKHPRFAIGASLTPEEAITLGGMVESSAYFNPFAPTGHYTLDMSVDGDRDTFKAILGLDKVCISKPLIA